MTSRRKSYVTVLQWRRRSTPLSGGTRCWRDEVPAGRDVPAAAQILREQYGHDAIHVCEAGLRGADDPLAAVLARTQSAAVVTEKVADVAAERDVVFVFVRKRNLRTSQGPGRLWATSSSASEHCAQSGRANDAG